LLLVLTVTAGPSHDVLEWSLAHAIRQGLDIRSGERRLSLRVFGRLPFIGVRGRTEAGVRKAWKEETAGEFAPTLVPIYGEFAGAG
jgi:hypothetical protein